MKKNSITQTGAIPSKFAPKIGASVGKNDYGKAEKPAPKKKHKPVKK